MGWRPQLPQLTAASVTRWRPKRTLQVVAHVLTALSLVVAVGCSQSSQQVRLDGSWVPEAVPSGTFGPQFDPTKAAITFRDDGTWSASDGCNDLSGTFTVSGERFESASRGGLLGVGCVRGQVEYEELLDTAVLVRRSGADLEFYDGDDNLVLRLRPMK